MFHSSSLGSRYKSTSSETKCFFWNTLNLITFQQVTEEIELSPCKWVLPRLWLHSSQSVSWFQGRNLGSWRVFYDQSQLNWNRKPTANKNQNNNKKSKQEMLLVWQSYGLVYSRMQWTMQTLIFLDFFFLLFTIEISRYLNLLSSSVIQSDCCSVTVSRHFWELCCVNRKQVIDKLPQLSSQYNLLLSVQLNYFQLYAVPHFVFFLGTCKKNMP